MRQALLTLGLLAIVAIAASFTVHLEQDAAGLKSLVAPGALSPRHAYIGDRCTACHEPMVGVTVAKCTACHADDERLLARQPTAFHESVGECAPCHLEHLPASVRPSAMEHVELARIGVRTLARASRRREADSRATLGSLRAWLGVDAAERFDAISAREALNCAGCHDRHDPHFGRFASDCAQCHGFDSWSIAGYQHPSPRSTACVQCHQAPPSHFMGHFSMVSRRVAGKEHASVDECFACHNTTGWNDIVGVGFYKHH